MPRSPKQGRRALAAACVLVLALVPAAQARLGDLDAGFDGDGIAQPAVGAGAARFEGVVVRPDGRVLAAGSADGRRAVLAQLTPAGALDPSFGVGGVRRVAAGVAIRTARRGAGQHRRDPRRRRSAGQRPHGAGGPDPPPVRRERRARRDHADRRHRRRGDRGPRGRRPHRPGRRLARSRRFPQDVFFVSRSPGRRPRRDVRRRRCPRRRRLGTERGRTRWPSPPTARSRSPAGRSSAVRRARHSRASRRQARCSAR